jgi:uncharacterized cupredoxin-like copper-binding protein
MVKRWIAPAMALAFGLAACGSSSKAAAPASSAASSTTAAATTTAAAPTCKAVGDIATAGSKGDYTLNEFTITGPATAKAGKVGFNLTNAGKASHEFVVFKGDFASLPKNENGTVDESKLTAGTLVGRVGKFPGAGQTCTGEFDLAAGTYTLVCNIEFKNGPTVISHAAKGMHLGVTVS